MPDTHVHILGFDENVFVFTVLTAVLAFAFVLLRSGVKDAAYAVH
jgi:hypothetical protein